jgi:hypothetical protein
LQLPEQKVDAGSQAGVSVGDTAAEAGETAGWVIRAACSVAKAPGGPSAVTSGGHFKLEKAYPVQIGLLWPR